jgi:transposase
LQGPLLQIDISQISHYVFKKRFERPGKGNDKGKVEALVKFARRSQLTPVPRVASIDDLNADLEAASSR